MSRVFGWLIALILGGLAVLGAACQEREQPPTSPAPSIGLGSPVGPPAGSPSGPPVSAASPRTDSSPARATPVNRPAGPVVSPSPAISPSPAGSPSPASPFIPAAQGEFGPIATYQPMIDLLPAEQRARLAPAIVTNAETRSPRRGAELHPMLVVAPEAAAIDGWPERAPPGQAPVDFTSLDPTRVYLNPAAAQVLGVTADDPIDFYLGVRPTQVRVERVLPADVLPRPEPTVYLALATAQVMLGRPDQVNAVLLDPDVAGGPLAAELPIVPLPADPAALAGRLAPR